MGFVLTIALSATVANGSATWTSSLALSKGPATQSTRVVDASLLPETILTSIGLVRGQSIHVTTTAVDTDTTDGSSPDFTKRCSVTQLGAGKGGSGKAWEKERVVSPLMPSWLSRPRKEVAHIAHLDRPRVEGGRDWDLERIALIG